MKKLLKTLVMTLGVYTIQAQPSWNVAYNGTSTSGISGLAASGNVIIAGTENTNTPLTISSDGGITWNTTSLLGVSGLAISTKVYAIAVNTVAGVTTWYAGTWGGNGILLSTNSGANWNAVLFPGNYPTDQTNGMFVDGNNVYAAGNYGLYVTTNGGTNWANILNGSYSTPINSVAVAGGNIYISGGYSGNTTSGVFMATAIGAGFANVSNPTGAYSTHGSQTLFALNNNIILAGNESGTLITTNSGSNWTLASSRPIYSYASVGGNNIVAGTSYYDRIVLSTNAGVSWQTVNTGLSNGYFSSLLVYKNAIITGNSSATVIYQTPLTNSDFDLSLYALTLSGNNSQLISVNGTSMTHGFSATSSNTSVVSVSSVTGNVFSLTANNATGSASVTVTSEQSFFEPEPKSKIIAVETISTTITGVTPTQKNTSTAYVYPNPFKTSFIIEGSAEFTIYDYLGEKQNAEVVLLSETKKQVVLNRSGVFILYTPDKTFKLVSE